MLIAYQFDIARFDSPQHATPQGGASTGGGAERASGAGPPYRSRRAQVTRVLPGSVDTRTVTVYVLKCEN